eukprot:SAG31_NODE_6403_length_2032_cov_1.316606_1_plen_158_part_00
MQSHGFESAADLLACEMGKSDFKEINIKIKDRSFIMRGLQQLTDSPERSEGTEFRMPGQPAVEQADADAKSTKTPGGNMMAADCSNDGYSPSTETLLGWQAMPLAGSAEALQRHLQTRLEVASADGSRQVDLTATQRSMQKVADMIVAGQAGHCVQR